MGEGGRLSDLGRYPFVPYFLVMIRVLGEFSIILPSIVQYSVGGGLPLEKYFINSFSKIFFLLPGRATEPGTALVASLLLRLLVLVHLLSHLPSCPCVLPLCCLLSSLPSPHSHSFTFILSSIMVPPFMVSS